MPTFHVTWECSFEADTHLEAALKAEDLLSRSAEWEYRPYLTVRQDGKPELVNIDLDAARA